jgi:5'-nucleotidase
LKFFFCGDFVTLILVYKQFFGVVIYYRKKEESQESDFKDAVAVCLPVINAAIRDIEKGFFPKSCSLNIEIPTSPSANKVSTIMYFSQIAAQMLLVIY